MAKNRLKIQTAALMGCWIVLNFGGMSGCGGEKEKELLQTQERVEVTSLPPGETSPDSPKPGASMGEVAHEPPVNEPVGPIEVPLGLEEIEKLGPLFILESRDAQGTPDPFRVMAGLDTDRLLRNYYVQSGEIHFIRPIRISADEAGRLTPTFLMFQSELDEVLIQNVELDLLKEDRARYSLPVKKDDRYRFYYLPVDSTLSFQQIGPDSYEEMSLLLKFQQGEGALRTLRIRFKVLWPVMGLKHTSHQALELNQFSDWDRALQDRKLHLYSESVENTSLEKWNVRLAQSGKIQALTQTVHRFHQYRTGRDRIETHLGLGVFSQKWIELTWKKEGKVIRKEERLLDDRTYPVYSVAPGEALQIDWYAYYDLGQGACQIQSAFLGDPSTPQYRDQYLRLSSVKIEGISFEGGRNGNARWCRGVSVFPAWSEFDLEDRRRVHQCFTLKKLGRVNRPHRTGCQGVWK